MKKVICLFLALVMCLSLAACGGSEEKAQAADSQKPAGKLTEDSTEAPAEVPAEAPVDPFAHLQDEYTLQLPIYTLETFYSSLGNDTYTYSNVTHDEQGRIVSWDKQENDHRANGYTATYDENGRLESVTYHNSLYGYTEVYVYNEQGLLINKTETDPEDEDYYLTNTYEYDENGVLVGGRTMSSSDFYDGGIDEYTFTTNEQGWIVENTDYAVDIEYLHENKYTYNDAGQLTESHESTIDEGILKYIYETTYEYDAYGFPVYAYVDNSYDYKGDTVVWECRSTYAATGSISAGTADDEMLRPVSDWVAYDKSNAIPAADSVLSGLTLASEQDGEYRYAIPAGAPVTPEYEIFGIMQGLDSHGIIDLRAYSVQEGANQVLWRYEAVLTQLLGLQTSQLNDKLAIMDGSVSLGTLGLEFSDGTYYLVVTLNEAASGNTGNAASGTPAAEPANALLAVEEKLQGTWEYLDESVGFGEILVFSNGNVEYTSYLTSARDKDTVVKGTYQVTDFNVITTLNGHESCFSYAVNGDQLTLGLYIDSGYDKGTTRVYVQTERGTLDPSQAAVNRTSSDNSASVGEAKPSSKGTISGYVEVPSGNSNDSVTSGQRNALKTAKDYLSVMAFSHQGLIEQLEYEGYTYSEAKYGADNCGADWYEQAALCAAAYLDVMSFSRSGLIDQLEYEGFTNAQAVYGVDAVY